MTSDAPAGRAGALLRNCNDAAIYSVSSREISIGCVTSVLLLTTDVLVDDKKNVSSNWCLRANCGCRDVVGLRYEHDGSGRGQFRTNANGRVAVGVPGRAAEGCGIAGFIEFERAGAFGAGT